MIVAPAVDLRGGRCVQLVGGDPDQEAVALANPTAVARSWRERGFATLHLVDLDAALGHGSNAAQIRDILSNAPGDAQVGGGVRSEANIDTWLEAGAARVIVGTSAVNDPDWAIRQAEARPNRIVIAADVRDGQVLRRGWTEASDWPLEEFLGALSAAPVAGALITDVGREGRLEGMDNPWIEQVAESQTLDLWMSGGVTSIDDVRMLKRAGVHGVVIGMALYTGRIDPDEVRELSGGTLA